LNIQRNSSLIKNCVVGELGEPAEPVYQYPFRLGGLLLGRGLVTTNDGRTSLATRATYPGDHIAILHGLSIPFIVCPIRRSPKCCVYQLVAPCYIHGLMHATEDDVQSLIDRSQYNSAEDRIKAKQEDYWIPLISNQNSALPSHPISRFSVAVANELECS
jgi:hypothetical protein